MDKLWASCCLRHQVVAAAELYLLSLGVDHLVEKEDGEVKVDHEDGYKG